MPDFPTRKECAAAGLVMAALLVLVYHSTLTAEYGMWDDYAFLLNIFTDRKPYFPWNIAAQGRPLYALFVEATYSWAGDVAGLWKVRALGIFGLWAFAVSAYITLCRFGWPKPAAFTLAVACCLIPAAGVYAGWAATAQIPYAGLAAWWAGYWLLRGKQAMITVSLLLISLCLYQTAATCFWLPVIFFLLSPSHQYSTEKTWRLGVRALAWFGGTVALYYVCYKLGIWVFCAENNMCATPTRRMKLVDAPWDKAVWFLGTVLPLALSAPYLKLKAGYALVILLVTTTGLGVSLWQRRAWLLAMAVVAVLPLLFFPHLVIAVSQAPFRVLWPLGMMLLGYLWVSFYALLPARLAYMAMAGFTLFLAITGWYHVDNYMVAPYAREYALLREQLTAESPPAEVILLRAPWQNLLPGVSREAEYGLLTSTLPQPNILGNLFKEHFGAGRIPPLRTCPDFFDANGCFTPKMLKEAVVIDGREVVRRVRISM